MKTSHRDLGQRLPLIAFLFLGFTTYAKSEEGHCGHPVSGHGQPPTPVSYRDPRTGIVFYVETDGRHLAAIGGDGKLLWVRNPFEDSKLRPYRSQKPIIISIEPAERVISALSREPQMHMNAEDKYIEIQFDSSQFGLVDERTGLFTLLGQN